MNKCRIFLVFVCLPVLFNAQVSLNESSLPSANDVFKTQVDNVPNINLKKQGEDQYWDFTSLSSGLAYQKTLLKNDPEQLHTDFEFDYLIREDNGLLRFYRKTGKKIFEVAIQRPHPLNSSLTVVSRYDDPKLIMYAPMSYKDDLTDLSSISFKLAGNTIPSIIRKRLPVTPDSIRISYRETRDFRVDAWGQVLLSYDRFEVLRQEISSTINTSIEIYSAGKWSRIDNTVLDPTGDLLGLTHERYFVFYSDEVKEPLAKIKVNASNKALYAEIRASDEMKNFISGNTNKKVLLLSPNPTYGDVKLELMNLDYGSHNFEVFNILGEKLWGEEITVDRKLNSYRYNFSFLGKGTYLWAITDAQGVRLTTKRLVIITP